MSAMQGTDLKAAIALHRAGDLKAAVRAYRSALVSRPEDAAAWEYCGIALAALDAHGTGAGAAMRHALLLQPGRGSTWFNLAALFVRREHGDPHALTAFRRATATDPGNAGTWMQRAHTAIRLGRNKEAAAAHVEATRLAPLDAGNWEQRTILLRRLGRLPEAERVSRLALALLPGAGNLWAARSAAFYEMDRLPEALTAGRRGTTAAPGNADAHANCAQARYRLGDIEGAIRSGGEALRLRPGDPVVAFNIGLYSLSFGDLSRGWRFYEARLIPTVELRRNLPASLWAADGSAGRKLIVPAEQGLGDEILFASCFPDLARLKESGTLESVAIEVTDRLRPLMERSFPAFDFFDRIRKADARLQAADYGAVVRETGADCAIMAGSLPSRFRPNLSAFPKRVSYLAPDPERLAHWREFLRAHGAGPVIGLSWRSRAGRTFETVYYPGADNLAPFLSIKGVRFVTLQYDENQAELAAMEERHGVTILRPEGLDLTNDLDGVTALIAALDAVVSPQNLVLSLAGALGKPGYTMPHTANWVSLGTGGMPFYPSVRLDRRREEEGQDWGPVMGRLAAALSRDLGLA